MPSFHHQKIRPFGNLLCFPIGYNGPYHILSLSTSNSNRVILPKKEKVVQKIISRMRCAEKWRRCCAHCSTNDNRIGHTMILHKGVGHDLNSTCP